MLIDPPIGTPAERAAGQVWPGTWFDANPYLNWYEISPGVWNYHTGSDLNNNQPVWNSDYHSPIVAIADGIVIFAGIGGGSWGHIIVISHVDDHFQHFYSRYGHIETPQVSTGQPVNRGQHIANVGNGDGTYAGGGEHLHFDICITELLHTTPNQWPGTNKQQVLANYVDPKAFILKVRTEVPLNNLNLQRGNKVKLYAGPGFNYAVQHAFAEGTPVPVDDQNPHYDPSSGATFYATPVDGWIEASAVGLPELSGPPQPTILYVNTPGTYLILRKTGDKTGEDIAHMPHQTQVVMLQSANANGYDQISVSLNGQPPITGFASAQYLVTSRP